LGSCADLGRISVEHRHPSCRRITLLGVCRATIAADNGASAHTPMMIFGWSTLRQAEHYTRSADQKRLAATGMLLIVSGQRKNKSA
jgi:hypothetical protein